MLDDLSAKNEAQKQIEHNFRWNFFVNAMDGANYWLGLSFISSAIILPLFVRHFTQDPIIIGFIPFINTAGFLLPQLFMSNVVEQASVKKFFPVTLGFFLERLPVILYVPMIYFMATRFPLITLALFFVLYTWANFGAGFVAVGWQDMVAKIIPVDKRGRFFGITNFIGNGTGIMGAIAVPFLLEKYTFPQGYVIAFGVAAIFIFFSWVFLSLTREPPLKSPKPVVSQKVFFKSLPKILREDRNFRMYLLSQVIFSLGAMASGFLAVYAVQTWNLPDSEASGFTLAYQIGLAVANLLFGFLADRKGHKVNLEICLLLNSVAILVAVLARAPWLFFLIFFIRGAVNAGSIISTLSIVYEFTTSENRPTYIGLANTLPGIPQSIAPLLGGWMAAAISYQSMFVVSIIFGVAAWVVLHFWVAEPRHTAI